MLFFGLFLACFYNDCMNNDCFYFFSPVPAAFQSQQESGRLASSLLRIVRDKGDLVISPIFVLVTEPSGVQLGRDTTPSDLQRQRKLGPFSGILLFTSPICIKQVAMSFPRYCRDTGDLVVSLATVVITVPPGIHLGRSELFVNPRRYRRSSYFSDIRAAYCANECSTRSG